MVWQFQLHLHLLHLFQLSVNNGITCLDLFWLLLSNLSFKLIKRSSVQAERPYIARANEVVT